MSRAFLFVEKGEYSMQELEELREVPATWRDYLKQTAETIGVCRWVWVESFSQESRRRLKHLMGALVVTTAFGVIQPRLTSYIFDGLVQKNLRLVIIGLVSFLLSLLAQKFSDYYYSYAREWIIGLQWGTLDRRVTELMFEKSVGQHIQESGRLGTANIDRGKGRLIGLLIMLLFGGVTTIVSLVFAYLLSFWLGIVPGILFTVVILGNLAWMLYLNREVVEVCTPIDTDMNRLTRYRLERWTNIERVKTSAKESEELATMTEWFDAIIGRDRGFWTWFIKQSLLRQMIGVAGLIMIMGYGSWRVWHGAWAIGLLYPLFMWSTQIVQNIWQIGHIEHQLNWNLPAIRSMIEALSIPPDVDAKPDGIRIAPHEPITISFEHIGHTYPLEDDDDDIESPSPVLQDISFEIRAGRKVALIGFSGVGKTTIANLLLCFTNPEKGSIYINGHNLQDCNKESWKRAVGYIPQKAQIFEGTLRYNLTYALTPEERKEWTDERLWELMRSLKIDFGRRLKKGLDTVVGERGMKLSGGQAQRIMIGAAAIKQPRFMIIDEATSSLDSSTEKAVHHGLAKILKPDVGALVIAHRLSTVEDLCDTFIVLRLAEQIREGESQIEAIAHSFGELHRISPTFRQLARDQNLFQRACAS